VLLKQQRYFSATAMAQALGLIFAGGVVLAAYAGYSVIALGREANTLSARVAADQAQLTKLASDTKVVQKDKAVEEALRNAENEMKALQQVSDVLGRGGMGNTQGYSEYLRGFARQIPSGVWLTGFNIQGAGSEIALYGRALQPDLVPAYVGRLKSEPVMQGKSFATLEINVPEAENTAAGAPGSRVEAQPPPRHVEFALRSAGLAMAVPGTEKNR
jgi:Tfp pilus assembly protein PilN